MSKPIIGLTGGIASGKSTIAGFFEELGIPVIDADQLAREVVAPGSEGLAEVVEAFGDGVLFSDGSLDRKKLGALVFSDEDARMKLNAITHPRIGALGAERIASHQESAAPYLIYEAALLVEGGIHAGFDGLVVVAVESETQLQRLMARDRSSREEAEGRISSQLPMSRKVEVADHVIMNEGTLDQARERVQQVHEAILSALRARS